MTIRKSSLAILASFAVSLAALAADSGSHAHGPGSEHGKKSNAEYHQAMEKMSQDMKSMPMNGDPDVDFAQMMVRHHQSGIEMAQAQLKHGDDPQIRKMSQKIVKEQKKEIERLQAWIKKNENK